MSVNSVDNINDVEIYDDNDLDVVISIDNEYDVGA